MKRLFLVLVWMCSNLSFASDFPFFANAKEMKAYFLGVSISPTFEGLQALTAKSSFKSSIRAVTFNVHEFQSLDHIETKAQTFKMLKAINAHLIALQEASFTDWPTLDGFKEQNTHVVSCAASKHGDKTSANTLISLFPIEESETFALPYYKDPRCAILARVKIKENIRLNVIATHLDNSYASIQKDELTAIFEKMVAFSSSADQEYPTLLMADFNAVLDSDKNIDLIRNNDEKNYRETAVLKEAFMQQHYFVDSFRLTGKQAPAYTSWSGRRVDYIFVNKGKWHIDGASYILPVNLSDHYPVVFDFNTSSHP